MIYIHRAILVTVAVCLFLFGTSDVLASGNSTSKAEYGLVSASTRARMQDIARRRKELQAQVELARKKELLALSTLRHIRQKLDITNHALSNSKHKLKKTENKISETEQNLTQTQSDTANLTEQATKRLREIYEGQRLNIVEMIFQVQTLQSLLDLFYYEERVAEMDSKLIEELRQRSQVLAMKKENLGMQKNKLGDLISEFAKKALMINQEKLNQEQIAQKLKTQRAFYEQAEKQLEVESEQIEQQIKDMESRRSSKEMAQGSGDMRLPLVAQVTSPFGWRKHPIFGIRRFHTGVDLAGPNHAPIKAADSGNVLYTGWYGGYGKVVIVSHGRGMATLYAHLSVIATQAGRNIHKGDVIGYEGTTGFSTGPHLHFEVRVDGKPNNPLNYVR